MTLEMISEMIPEFSPEIVTAPDPFRSFLRWTRTFNLVQLAFKIMKIGPGKAILELPKAGLVSTKWQTSIKVPGSYTLPLLSVPHPWNDWRGMNHVNKHFFQIFEKKNRFLIFEKQRSIRALNKWVAKIFSMKSHSTRSPSGPNPVVTWNASYQSHYDYDLLSCSQECQEFQCRVISLNMCSSVSGSNGRHI